MLRGLYPISSNHIKVNHDMNWRLVKGEVCKIWHKYMRMDFGALGLPSWFPYGIEVSQEAQLACRIEFSENCKKIG